MKPSVVDLRIEELVLRGFERVNGPYVAIVVQRELTRLVAEGGVPPAWRRGTSVAQVEGAAVELDPGAPADTLGVRIARSIYLGLGGGTAPDGRPAADPGQGGA